MGFYKNVRTEIKTHHPDQEEYIKIGEIRYIKSLDIFYECVDYDEYSPEEGRPLGWSGSYTHQCSMCIFGDDSIFTDIENCKMCGFRERPDHTDVIFRPVKIEGAEK